MRAEQQVLDLYRDILENGRTNGNRTGTDSIRVFGRQMRFDLSTAFPLLTTKKINFKNIVTELLWFIKGDTNISYLKEHGCNIWNQWALNIKAINSDRAFEIARDLITRDSLPYDAAELTVRDRNVILLNYGVGSYECTDIPLFLDDKRVLTETERLSQYCKVRGITLEEFATEREEYVTSLVQREFWTGGRAKAYMESKKQIETDMHALGIPYEVTQINPRQQNVKPYQDGSLGPVYGAQWTHWKVDEHKYINQLEECIHLLKTKPFSRRIIVSAWNPADLPDESVSPQENVLDGKMALAACHTLFQFFADKATVQERHQWLAKNDEESFKLYKSLVIDGKAGNDLAIREAADLLNEKAPELRLSCQLYQRSCDLFLGFFYNLASYALLTEMVAQVTNMIPGEFVWTGGDCHIYENHIDQVKEQLTREPYPLPTLRLNRDITDINAFTHDDIVLENYQSHAFIKAPVAV